MTTSVTEISHVQFVEKYKLIPKQLRFQFLEFLRQMPYMYNDDWNIDIFDDLIDMLVLFDESADSDNYTYLTQTLCDEVYAGPCEIYHDVISCLLRYLQWKIPIITERDVIDFHKKSVLRQIREQVAYRPGNHGYELCREHFYSLCM